MPTIDSPAARNQRYARISRALSGDESVRLPKKVKSAVSYLLHWLFHAHGDLAVDPKISKAAQTAGQVIRRWVDTGKPSGYKSSK